MNDDTFVKDGQTVLPDGTLIEQLLHGVKKHEQPNIITRNGVATEVFRNDWGLTPYQILHMIHVRFRAGAISAWHYHKLQTDHIMVIQGTIKLVLFDARDDSPSHGKVNVFHLSPMRPTLIVLPPGIVHGLQNLEAGDSAFVNFFDREYRYDDPDEYRLPLDSDRVPYRF